jgi:predicted transcriptional regulator
MLKELVWGSPEDSVQQAITKMQQYDSGYLMVGINGTLEGIVSNSNITWALSPYLRPIFAKWRRPLDHATLQIRIKWIMSRPVHIVKPETPLANVMENMCRYGVLCLPVVDQQGKAQGLVTEVNVFKVLLSLQSSPNILTSGNEQKKQSKTDHWEIKSTPRKESDLVAQV